MNMAEERISTGSCRRNWSTIAFMQAPTRKIEYQAMNNGGVVHRFTYLRLSAELSRSNHWNKYDASRWAGFAFRMKQNQSRTWRVQSKSHRLLEFIAGMPSMPALKWQLSKTLQKCQAMDRGLLELLLAVDISSGTISIVSSGHSVLRMQ